MTGEAVPEATAEPVAPAKPIRRRPPPSEEAIAYALGARLEGHQVHHIRDALTERWPGERAEAVLRAVDDRLQEARLITPAAEIGFCLLARRAIYRKAMEAGSFTAALKAIEDLEAMVPPLESRTNR